MNAIELLKQHHRTTRETIEQMLSTREMEPSEVRLMADELVAHMLIEEQIFYPRVKELAPDLVPEAFEEHAVARFELARLILAKEPETALARLRVLNELLLEHIEEEEMTLFRTVEPRLGLRELEELGTQMETMFDRAAEAGFESVVVPDTQELREFEREETAASRGAPVRRRRGGASPGR